MKTIYKTIGNIEYKLDVSHDEDPESPREWDNLGTLVTAHRNYTGDEELSEDCFDIESAFKEHLSEEGLSMNDIYYHKVWLMDHSGVSIKTSPFGCRWDSGQWGYIYVSKDKIKTDTLLTTNIEQRALEILNNEIETLNQYYQGDVYQYILESRHVEHSELLGKDLYTDWEQEDSCTGFYGEQGLIECDVEHFTKEELKKIFD